MKKGPLDLDKEEQEILDAFEAGKFESVMTYKRAPLLIACFATKHYVSD